MTHILAALALVLTVYSWFPQLNTEPMRPEVQARHPEAIMVASCSLNTVFINMERAERVDTVYRASLLVHEWAHLYTGCVGEAESLTYQALFLDLLPLDTPNIEYYRQAVWRMQAAAVLAENKHSRIRPDE